jgi:hypothetical protein
MADSLDNSDSQYDKSSQGSDIRKNRKSKKS